TEMGQRERKRTPHVSSEALRSLSQRSGKTLLPGNPRSQDGSGASLLAQRLWFLPYIVKDIPNMRMHCFKCFGQGPPGTTTWCRSASTQISGSFWRHGEAGLRTPQGEAECKSITIGGEIRRQR